MNKKLKKNIEEKKCKIKWKQMNQIQENLQENENGDEKRNKDNGSINPKMREWEKSIKKKQQYRLYPMMIARE